MGRSVPPTAVGRCVLALSFPNLGSGQFGSHEIATIRVNLAVVF